MRQPVERLRRDPDRRGARFRLSRAIFPGDPGRFGAGIAFRPIVDADLPFLRDLYASTRRDELAIVPWTDAQKHAFLSSQFALQHAHYRQFFGRADFLLITRDGAPIGRVYVHRDAPDEIRLMEIALAEPERGRGLGGRLIAALMDEARDAGAKLTLHVEPNNPALRLYRRLGFELIEQRGVYLFLGWTPDALS